jgi:uncharacterized coiled-coil protein SlyX
VHDFFSNLASVVKAKASGKQLLVGTMEDKIQLCILYVLDQVSVCARKIRSGIISKKAFSEHYRYKDMLVWNCPTFCRMIWNGIANAFYTVNEADYTEQDTFKFLPDWLENLTCNIARDRPALINHFLDPSIQRSAHGEEADDVVEYSGDWEIDRMEFSRAFATDPAYATSPDIRLRIVDQAAEDFVYAEWKDESVSVPGPVIRPCNRGDTLADLTAAYSQIEVAASLDQLENQLKILAETFGNDVSADVNRLRTTLTQKSSLIVVGSDDKASDRVLVKDPAVQPSPMLPPQISSSATAAVSTSKSSAPLPKRAKIIFDDDADDDMQDSDAVNVKKQTSQRDSSSRLRATLTKRAFSGSGLADGGTPPPADTDELSELGIDATSQKGSSVKTATDNKSVRTLRKHVDNSLLQFTAAVTAITDRLDSTTNKTDKAIGSHEKSVNELTNRVAKQSVEINALRDRVALLENQLKEYASCAKKIETWEKDFS